MASAVLLALGVCGAVLFQAVVLPALPQILPHLSWVPARLPALLNPGPVLTNPDDDPWHSHYQQGTLDYSSYVMSAGDEQACLTMFLVFSTQLTAAYVLAGARASWRLRFAPYSVYLPVFG